jgi:hypothetical protein
MGQTNVVNSTSIHYIETNPRDTWASVTLKRFLDKWGGELSFVNTVNLSFALRSGLGSIQKLRHELPA